jgi:hypothetical protein
MQSIGQANPTAYRQREPRSTTTLPKTQLIPSTGVMDEPLHSGTRVLNNKNGNERSNLIAARDTRA